MKTGNSSPGQRWIKEFPRFGLTPFAQRIPAAMPSLKLRTGGLAREFTYGTADFEQLPRVEQTCDFHCVTTWSYPSLCWSGYRFRDFYAHLVARNGVEPSVAFAVFRSLDGYNSGLTLSDLLAEEVLLADRLNGAPLSIKHGAPLRLIAPAHYGYKNPKHLKAVEFWRDTSRYRPSGYRFMDHPRARVALEERGRWLPGRVYRYLYRPLINPTIKKFKAAWRRHERAAGIDATDG